MLTAKFWLKEFSHDTRNITIVHELEERIINQLVKLNDITFGYWEKRDFSIMFSCQKPVDIYRYIIKRVIAPTSVDNVSRWQYYNI